MSLLRFSSPFFQHQASCLRILNAKQLSLHQKVVRLHHTQFLLKSSCEKRCLQFCNHLTKGAPRYLQSTRTLAWTQSAFFSRQNSGITANPEATTNVTQLSQDLPAGYIPPPPAAPEPVISEGAEVLLNALGEPTFASLDLAHWTPAGFVQMGLEQLHILGMPWWSAIVAGTIALRFLIFPLVILGQRNAANMSNHMPTVQKLQDKFSRARASGNTLEAARTGQELMDYMKRNEVKPFKNMLVPFAQLPIFLSVFVGVRQMANLPVQSLATGGLFWFTDLTVADPFYLLPILTMSTFLITIELGVDGMKTGQMSHTMKWVMRAMPIIIFPFILNFPAAMLCYWFTSNAFSLVQVSFLKIPRVKEFFKIPTIVPHDQAAKQTKKGFVEGFKDTWSNSKVMAQMEDRQRADAIQFRDAGSEPIKKTYSYNPKKTAKKASS